KYARIHRSDDIHRRVQFLLSHPRFPCVRKAPVYSRIAKPHHCHRQPDEHLLPVSETGHRVGVTVELTEISALQNGSLLSDSTWVSSLESGNSNPETRHPKPAQLIRLDPTDKRVRKA